MRPLNEHLKKNANCCKQDKKQNYLTHALYANVLFYAACVTLFIAGGHGCHEHSTIICTTYFNILSITYCS